MDRGPLLGMAAQFEDDFSSKNAWGVLDIRV